MGDKTYVVERSLGRGGSGEAFLVQMAGRRFALKVFFPFYQFQLALQPGNTTELVSSVSESASFQRREYEFLAALEHPNIVRVWSKGEINLSATERKGFPIKSVPTLPVLVTEFVEGAPLQEALAQGLTGREFAYVLIRLARALEYLHAERSYMHADLKSANILIRAKDKEPVLIDFALSKNLNFSEVAREEKTRLLGDWDLFPKELPTDHQLRKIKETDGRRGDLFRLAFPYLDLFQVGKLLRFLRPQYAKLFDASEVRYLDELAEQLCDWSLVTKWGPRDLGPRVERLGTEHFAAFGVPELVAAHTAERTIMIPPGVGVPMTRQVERIVETRSFRRLGLINQLSLLSGVYPGADYKRIVHVLYAYELAREFVTHLFGSPKFRMLFDTRATQQLLLTVLLHDINHFPFLHIFQESQIPKLDKVAVLDLFCDGNATGEKAAGEPSIYDLLADVGIEPERFRRLIFGEHHRQEGEHAEVDQAISSLLNSGVDVDKLSYLRLDSHFSGVRYGQGIDLPTLLKAVVLGRYRRVPEKPLHIAFEDRALQAVENVVMTRFWHFRSLYWHHTNRALMAMILDVVRTLYVDQERDVHDYLLDTLWLNDIEAVRYLERKYHAQLGAHSSLNGLIEDRRRMFKRIYTVQAGAGDAREDDIYGKLRRMGVRQELRFRTAMAIGLGSLLGTARREHRLSAAEVLVDVPKREMDSGGQVFLSSVGEELVPLVDLSEPVRSISINYDKLTKRARVFLSPQVALLDREWRAQNRKELQSVILQALDVSQVESEVR